MKRRLARLLLLARCLLRGLVRGAANKAPKALSRVIVVPTGKLGDVVCCTPVLAALRKHRPDVHIIVAGNAKLHEPLLADSGLADEYLDLEEPGAFERVKATKADAAILTGHGFEYAAWFCLAGIPLVVGPRALGIDSPEETRPYKMLLPLIASFPHEFKAYAPRERLRALEPLSIREDDTHKRLGFSQKGEGMAKKIVAGISQPYTYLVGISVGAGNKEKCWPGEKFAEVATHLIKNRGAHIVLIGSARDTEENQAFLGAMKDTSHLTNATHLSLDELKALIAELDLFVSVNTGPLYIAEAFDVSTVDILGPVNPWDQPPQGRIHKMVLPPGRPKPLLLILDSRRHDIEEAERIARSTRVEDVIAAADEALSELAERRP